VQEGQKEEKKLYAMGQAGQHDGHRSIARAEQPALGQS